MLLKTAVSWMRSKNPLCVSCPVLMARSRYFNQELDNKYTETQKEKILEVMNSSGADDLSGFEITKGRLKKFSQWKTNNGPLKALSEVEYIEGFSERTAKKLFDSILEGPPKKVDNVTARIKGQILQPYLSETVRQSCKSILTVHIAVNSVCWLLIDKSRYEVTEWMYHGIDYPDGKRLQITDVMNIAWKVTEKLPPADICVMKAEETTLRAAGSDPNNPKVLAVNLQKAQMIAMIVALINARSHNAGVYGVEENGQPENTFSHKVYFLRPSLPYRLHGTLVGNERVSTDQTVETLLQSVKETPTNTSQVSMSEALKAMFRSQKDLQKDMLGHCLLLGLTFMDLCIYKNQNSINKLAKGQK